MVAACFGLPRITGPKGTVLGVADASKVAALARATTELGRDRQAILRVAEAIIAALDKVRHRH